MINTLNLKSEKLKEDLIHLFTNEEIPAYELVATVKRSMDYMTEQTKMNEIKLIDFVKDVLFKEYVLRRITYQEIMTQDNFARYYNKTTGKPIEEHKHVTYFGHDVTDQFFAADYIKILYDDPGYNDYSYVNEKDLKEEFLTMLLMKEI